MEAKDLMIGDWVNIYVFPNENPQKEDLFPARISTIMTPLPSEDSGEHCECQFEAIDGGVGCASRPIETCLPIPLTPEILGKNGWDVWFEHSKIARSITVLVEENTNLCILEVDGQDSMFVQLSHCGAGSFEFRKHLKYVHELQHIFRLVGLTDLANNFKV